MAAVHDISSAPAAISGAVADVDVCVCTFRRPSVVETLASLAAQRLPDGMRLRVIVADNDVAPTAREAVEGAFRANGLDGLYVHAPAQNISIARNACLDAVAAPIAAFIDDDETARPDWLARLIGAREEQGADIVFGRVEAGYAPDAPAWLAKADLHSTRAVLKRGAVDTGYTCNVLFRSAAVGGLRFDPALGRTGGEDTTFFNQLFTQGVRLAYCEDAVVDEPVPPARSSLRWLLKRSFRNGQTHGYMMLRNGQNRLKLIGLGAGKLAYCAGVAALSALSPAGWRKSAVRGSLHAGVVAAAFGKSPLELYR
jgi:succinoglycan biosynthesis protein ExoM